MLPDTLLRTERLILRPPAEGDLGAMVTGLNDWDVARFLARVPFPYGDKDAASFLHAARRAAAEGTDLNLLVEKDSSVVGCLGLAAIGSENEFGYWIAKPHWGQGLATEAARAFLGHCFTALGLKEIRAGAFADNPASLRVQWKLGFETAGFGTRQSLARGRDVAHIDTMLSRRSFEDVNR